ncbi:MAG: lytic murein transglycosylase B [Pseudomonadota bacterium]
MTALSSSRGRVAALLSLVISISGIGAQCVLAAEAPSTGFDLARRDIQSFATQVAKEHGLDRDAILATLADAKPQQSILKAISRPAEKSKPWHEYRAIFVTESRIKRGRAFMVEHQQALSETSERTGVPATIIAAIIGIETNYGRITGSYRVLDALTTLAFDYPRRSEFFTRELEHFFLLTREESVDALTVKGSYAGAMGAAQFMPSSYRLYAADGNDDASRDLWQSWDDVFASIANYFLAHGWQPDQPIAAAANASRTAARNLETTILTPAYRLGFLKSQGIEFTTSLDDNNIGSLLPYENADGTEHLVGFQNFFVITRYNRSRLYARSVLELSAALGTPQPASAARNSAAPR